MPRGRNPVQDAGIQKSSSKGVGFASSTKDKPLVAMSQSRLRSRASTLPWMALIPGSLGRPREIPELPTEGGIGTPLSYTARGMASLYL